MGNQPQLFKALMNVFLSSVLLEEQGIGEKVVDAEVASTKIKPIDIHNKANHNPT